MQTFINKTMKMPLKEILTPMDLGDGRFITAVQRLAELENKGIKPTYQECVNIKNNPNLIWVSYSLVTSRTKQTFRYEYCFMKISDFCDFDIFSNNSYKIIKQLEDWNFDINDKTPF